MKFLHDILEKQKPLFQKGGKFEKLYYLWEANETFLFTPATVTSRKGVQVRDAIDLKRMMMTVVIAMVPCLLFGIWNTGDQHFIAIGEADVATSMDKVLIGLQLVLPIVLVSYAAGGLAEVVFSLWRKHPINEGFLVTGMLIPLVCPATIPLWQVAVATIFAVVIAKEVFGGTGMNILNVAMTARAYLYFAHPQQISGSKVWAFVTNSDVPKDYTGALVEGYSGATPLALAASAETAGPDGTRISVVDNLTETAEKFADGMYDAMSMFIGTIPGCIGETSTLMCLIGAAILILTGVGSWKIIVSVFGGAYATAFLFEQLAVNSFMAMPAHYHLIMGGLAFAAVFMATDPVSASHTEKGKWIYGLMIGVLTVLIRVFNPAYPEGAMLAVLLMNVFAPLIDFYVVKGNKKRRLQRATV